MGRGRAKAKQTKVARQLKYSDGGTDLDALRRELVSGAPSDVRGPITDESSDSDSTDLDGENDDEDEDDAEDLDHRDFG